MKDLVQVNVLLYDKFYEDVAVIRKFGRTSVGKHSNTVRLLRCNSHNYYVPNITAFFKAYRSLSDDWIESLAWKPGEAFKNL